MSNTVQPPDPDDYEDLQAWLRAWVGYEIKRRRKREKLTADALADAVGVGIGQVFRWEAGTNEPTFERLAAVADTLTCAVGDLFPPFSKVRKVRKQLQAA